jgi:hypothetical protein
VVKITVDQADAPLTELEAQRGPFELEGSTGFYGKSLAAIKSARDIIRSAATSRTTHRTSFYTYADTDSDTTSSRSARTRLSFASSVPPLPTPSDYVGRDRRFTFGPRTNSIASNSQGSLKSSRSSSSINT